MTVASPVRLCAKCGGSGFSRNEDEELVCINCGKATIPPFETTPKAIKPYNVYQTPAKEPAFTAEDVARLKRTKKPITTIAASKRIKRVTKLIDDSLMKLFSTNPVDPPKPAEIEKEEPMPVKESQEKHAMIEANIEAILADADKIGVTKTAKKWGLGTSSIYKRLKARAVANKQQPKAADDKQPSNVAVKVNVGVNWEAEAGKLLSDIVRLQNRITDLTKDRDDIDAALQGWIKDCEKEKSRADKAEAALEEWPAIKWENEDKLPYLNGRMFEFSRVDFVRLYPYIETDTGKYFIGEGSEESEATSSKIPNNSHYEIIASIGKVVLAIVPDSSAKVEIQGFFAGIAWAYAEGAAK